MVKLPFYEAVNSTYPHNAHSMAILYAHEKYREWIKNCFIQIEGWDMENMDYEDFWILECPLIVYQRISKKIIESHWRTIVDFIIEMLNNEQYVYLLVKMAIIGQYENFCGEVHDALIYGYDEENKAFLMADFFKNGKYSTCEVPYKLIEEATKNFSEEQEKHWIFTADIILLEVPEREQPHFSLLRFRESIECYLKSEPTREWYHRSQRCYVRYQYRLIYGMDTYKILYNYIEKIKQERTLLPHWRQVFHLWYEHKCNMYNRIKYIENRYGFFVTEDYSNRYYRITKKAEMVLLLLIKYNITQNEKIADTVKKYVDEICMEEQKILDNIIKILANLEEDRRGRIDW